jgi:hypothetical protein
MVTAALLVPVPYSSLTSLGGRRCTSSRWPDTAPGQPVGHPVLRSVPTHQPHRTNTNLEKEKEK